MIPLVWQVTVSELDPEHAYIQITHVVPYFTPEELERRKTSFERANNISRFVFETPFTRDGKASGDVTKHCMMKTILTSEARNITASCTHINKIFFFSCVTVMYLGRNCHGNVTLTIYFCLPVSCTAASQWFPYVKKRIVVVDQEQMELSPIQVLAHTAREEHP